MNPLLRAAVIDLTTVTVDAGFKPAVAFVGYRLAALLLQGLENAAKQAIWCIASVPRIKMCMQHQQKGMGEFTGVILRLSTILPGETRSTRPRTSP